ncbi:hypothetical protein [Listeria cornellensis]|uniref:Uncharacterized protein n=1 Tax=Listeria cornellensis FSL F6-0969 TaxID=1265820 RepID=W7C679_9LIST|nr:hypothetical protein [Listeria cornellensis]EUJ28158.1 hypothetical protein PCORN_12667 [Listeria cornellensis FSL F6-0969]
MGVFLFIIGFLGFFYALIMLILGIFIRGKQLFKPRLNFIILAATFILTIVGANMIPATQTTAEPKVDVKSEEIQKDKQADKQKAAQKKIGKRTSRTKKKNKKNFLKHRQNSRKKSGNN